MGRPMDKFQQGTSPIVKEDGKETSSLIENLGSRYCQFFTRKRISRSSCVYINGNKCKEISLDL